MAKTSKKFKDALDQFLIYLVVVFLLLLSSFNLQNYLSSKNVLGLSIQEVSNVNQSSRDLLFWESFVEKNPNYIPGLIELGRMDKVREIDPNYELSTSN